MRRPYSSLMLLIMWTLLFNTMANAKEYRLKSPDNRIEVILTIDERVSYSVFHNSAEIIRPSIIALHLDMGIIPALNPDVTDVKHKTIKETHYPVVKLKSHKIKENCNELKLGFSSNIHLLFRAYNNGVAYRFVTGFNEKVKVLSEEVNFNFHGKDLVYFPEEDGFYSHNEREYKKMQLNELTPGSLASLPVLVRSNKTHVLITEADLYDYPGMWIKVNKHGTFSGVQAGVALKEEQDDDRSVRVIKHGNYIAETTGTREYPWRVMVIAEKEADLIINQLVYLLSSPLKLQDASWIKPGKVAWDWWNALNVYGVDFKAGVNTETYRYFIDFASKYGIEYIILDEGWYELGDLFSINPEIDMEALVAYGREKNVGIILWVIWKTLDDQLEAALDQFEKWGVKGIKVDFMQRDDQWMVNYYHKIAREAAARKLLVNFHGSYKPCGLRRAYPNVITREGVKGMEHCKVSDAITPKHNVTLPFIRMVPGPMDYTPGAMRNANPENFCAIFSHPMSMGTRCHQLAMYVIYESPLQMLSDSPSNYLREQECMEFLAKVPTVWDKTIVLHASVGEYVVIARRHENEWYIGAMTDSISRDFDINLSFLDNGGYVIDFFQDGVNAERYAADFKMMSTKVRKDDSMTIHLAPGGGWAAKIHPY